MDKRTREWVFVSMGLSIAATQGLLIRLLLVSFSGNELSIGLMLGNWLLAEALGSHLAGRFAHKLRNAYKSFLLLQAAFAIALPLVVCACYLVRRLAGVALGEALGFVSIFWTSLLLLAPLSALHGAMFSTGCAACAKATAQDSTLVGRLYVYEALGAMAGGVILTFVFIPHFNPIQTGLLLALLGLTTMLALLWSTTQLRRYAKWAAMVGVAACILLYFLLSTQALALHRALTQLRWGGAYHVVYDRDSPYGNVAVTQLLEQYTFLANGAPILTTPFPDIAAVEDIAHLPLLFHPDPRRILVIGGGLGGVLQELLKYPLEAIDYAELDPLVIEAVRACPTVLTKQELQDPRVHIHSIDGRLLVNQQMRQAEVAAYRYDIVLLNLPYPSTLELNRFYTEEFFRLVRQVLDERGLLVIPLPGSLTYVGPGLRDLNLMLQSGLQAVFANVRPIPGDTVLWLASPSLPLASTTQRELSAAWEKRGLATRFITAEYLKVRFAPQRLAWFEDALQTHGQTYVNRDLYPVGVLDGLAYWSEIFAPTAYRLLIAMRQSRLWQWCLLAVLATAMLGLVQMARGRRRGSSLPFVVITTGFAGMVCDLMIVLVFQALYGYMYQYVGLIIAAFMAGLALGGWATSRYFLSGASARGPLIDSRRALIGSELALIVYWLTLPVLLLALSRLVGAVWVLPALLLLNALGGCLVGLQFPLSSQLHLSARGEPGYTAGVLYAADLVGAFLGAIAVGIVLLPVLGTAGTCLFVAVLKVCSLLLLLCAR